VNAEVVVEVWANILLDGSDSSVIVTSVIAMQPGYMIRCKILVVDAWHPSRVHVDFKCWVCIIYGSHLLLMRALVSALVFRRMTTADRLAHHHQIQLHHLGMAALASLEDSFSGGHASRRVCFLDTAHLLFTRIGIYCCGVVGYVQRAMNLFGVMCEVRGVV
jgi:hypothetical protein